MATIYAEIYKARRARDAAKGTPGFAAANDRVAALYALARAGQ